MPEPLTFDDLVRFHREIILPDIERVVDSRLEKTNVRIDRFRSEMLTHFDGVYVRLERLDQEYQALRAAVERLEVRVERLEVRVERLEVRTGRLEARIGQLEERMIGLEDQLRRMAVRSDLDALEAQIVRLRERIAALEHTRDRVADDGTLAFEIMLLKEQLRTLRERVDDLDRRLGPGSME